MSADTAVFRICASNALTCRNKKNRNRTDAETEISRIQRAARDPHRGRTADSGSFAAAGSERDAGRRARPERSPDRHRGTGEALPRRTAPSGVSHTGRPAALRNGTPETAGEDGGAGRMDGCAGIAGPGTLRSAFSERPDRDRTESRGRFSGFPAGTDVGRMVDPGKRRRIRGTRGTALRAGGTLSEEAGRERDRRPAGD